MLNLDKSNQNKNTKKQNLRKKKTTNIYSHVQINAEDNYMSSKVCACVKFWRCTCEHRSNGRIFESIIQLKLGVWILYLAEWISIDEINNSIGHTTFKLTNPYKLQIFSIISGLLSRGRQT